MVKLVEKKYLWFSVSLVIIFAGILLLANRALNSNPLFNFGIDFSGGNAYILRFDQLNTALSEPANSSKETKLEFIASLRETLLEIGIEKNTIQITNNNDILIKTLIMNHSESQHILSKLRDTFGEIEVLEIDFIGPTIGHELKEQSIAIIIFVSIALLLYISIRFRFKYGIASLAALIHDTLIILSFTAFLELEINTAYVAALLTILGYSINDTIVIFDRIRENENKYGKVKLQNEIINMSIYQTMKRTIFTSLTTLFVVVSLLIFGGITIQTFTTVLLIGVISGTYSSVFIACPLISNKKPTI